MTILLALNFVVNIAFSQDWKGIEVPANPGSGMVWELQDSVSDDFNYDAPPTSSVNIMGGKWVNWYHNSWTGPLPTVWRRDHIFVEDGNMKVISSRPEGDSVSVSGQKLAVSNLGCATSTRQVQYPVYIEANVKIMKSVLASNVWLLSSDDTQEIDICEAYGSDRWNNPFFSNKRLHLSHHVFIRQPFTDWQPSDPGSFYTNDTTIWSDGYHRIGVYWRDPWHLEYYVDGELVRVRSGKNQIDPVFHTNAVNPGDRNNDTRTGLSKPMDIIINTEDQTWRALQGLTPTDEELANKEDNTFNVDWIRVYKPVEGQVGPVTAVSIDPSDVNTFVGDTFTLKANVVPRNANDATVVWESNKPEVASISETGIVTCHSEGEAIITVTTNENQLTATAKITVSGQYIAPSISFDDNSKYLNNSFPVGGNLEVSAFYHAGSGSKVIEGGLGGVKFWLREIRPGWSVANDYVISDSTAIGKESGTATGIISLDGVPATSEIPSQNWYFLYATFENSEDEFLDTGIFPIQIDNTTGTFTPIVNQLKIFPNPAYSLLNIEHKDLKGDYNIQLISATGEMIPVKGFNSNDKNLQLNIDHLPKGFYILRIFADNVYTASFIKK